MTLSLTLASPENRIHSTSEFLLAQSLCVLFSQTTSKRSLLIFRLQNIVRLTSIGNHCIYGRRMEHHELTLFCHEAADTHAESLPFFRHVSPWPQSGVFCLSILSSHNIVHFKLLNGRVVHARAFRWGLSGSLSWEKKTGAVVACRLVCHVRWSISFLV